VVRSNEVVMPISHRLQTTSYKLQATSLVLLLLATLTSPAPAASSDSTSSALISEQLDKQLDHLDVHGGLYDISKAIADATGVRVESDSSVYDALPWGENTTINASIKNVTLRQALDEITRRLGLSWTAGAEVVQFEPLPALRRLGRRATLDEIQVLDLLAARPLSLSTTRPTPSQLLEAIDQKLEAEKSPFAVENRAFTTASGDASQLNLPRNATMLDALELLTRQTDATWYPWGRSIVVLNKVDAVRLLLTKRITRRWRDVELSQVLLELAESSGTNFSYDPGVLQRVPQNYRRVNLILDNVTLWQTMENLSAATGLKFTPTRDGVAVTYAGPETRPSGPTQ
jgi:hypothetical protein